jgi:hypothetical protein
MQALRNLPRAGLPAPAGVPPLGLAARAAPLQRAKSILDAAGNDKGARKEALRDAAAIMSGEQIPVNVVDLAKEVDQTIDNVNFLIDEKYEEMKRLIDVELRGGRRRSKKSRKPKRKAKRYTRRR